MFKLLREIRNLLKEIRDELRKSNEPIRFSSEIPESGYIGHDINRVSRLSELSKMNIKQDIRKIRNKHSERLIAILQKQAAFNDEELRAADSIIEEFLSDKKILKEWIKSCHILNSKIKEELPNLRVYKLEYLSMIIHNIKASKIRKLKPFRES